MAFTSSASASGRGPGRGVRETSFGRSKCVRIDRRALSAPRAGRQPVVTRRTPACPSFAREPRDGPRRASIRPAGSPQARKHRAGHEGSHPHQPSQRGAGGARHQSLARSRPRAPSGGEPETVVRRGDSRASDFHLRHVAVETRVSTRPHRRSLDHGHRAERSSEEKGNVVGDSVQLSISRSTARRHEVRRRRRHARIARCGRTMSRGKALSRPPLCRGSALASRTLRARGTRRLSSAWRCRTSCRPPTIDPKRDMLLKRLPSSTRRSYSDGVLPLRDVVVNFGRSGHRRHRGHLTSHRQPRQRPAPGSPTRSATLLNPETWKRCLEDPPREAGRAWRTYGMLVISRRGDDPQHDQPRHLRPCHSRVGLNDYLSAARRP